MSQYERNKRWKEANRAKVAANQQRYRKENGREKAKDAFKKRLAKIVAWYREYKQTLQCSRCPEKRPATLQFHHRPGEKKKNDVCIMVSHAYGIDTILAEIAKCDVLCANCHAVEHDNYYSSLPPQS